VLERKINDLGQTELLDSLFFPHTYNLVKKWSYDEPKVFIELCRVAIRSWCFGHDIESSKKLFLC